MKPSLSPASSSRLQTTGATCRILGVDPGLGLTGFGCLDVTAEQQLSVVGWGCLTSDKQFSIARRLLELEKDFRQLIEQLSPDLVAIEQLFYFRNATTIIPVAQARGVLLLTTERYGIPHVEFTPMQVKQSLTGYGKASKPEMQSAVQQRLHLETIPRPDDAADGLAIALTAWQFGSHLPRQGLLALER